MKKFDLASIVVSLKPWKLGALASLLVFVITHLSGGLLYFVLKKSYKDEIYNGLIQTSTALAYGIDGNLYSYLDDKEQQGGKLYQKLVEPLTKTLMSSQGQISHIYTFKLLNDSIYYILDAQHSDSPSISKKMLTVLKSENSKLKSPFITKKTFVENDENCDQNSCFLSAISPIFNDDKDVVGVIKVDVSLSQFNEKMTNIQNRAILISVISILFSILIFFIVRMCIYYLQKAMLESQELSNLKTEFMAVMSHEIRTPLNGIIGVSQNLEEHIGGEEGKSLLKTVQNSGEALLQIINDILDFSKIAAGKMQCISTPTSIRDLMNDVRSVFSSNFQKKEIHFEVKIDELVPPYIEVDSFRLRQILMNIIGNALKFTLEQGFIIVKVNVNLNELIFEVQDSGIGMSEDVVKRLFKPFVQAHSGTARKYGGTGLGLVICKNLVELMGGKIYCQSYVGAGSQFFWHLPLIVAKAPEKNSENVNLSHLNWTGKKALVVDDNDVNLRVAELMLKKLEVESVLCNNGFDAIKKVKEQKFDILFLDIQMPEIDGPNTLIEIKKENPDLNFPIVAFTANVLEEDQQKYKQLGFDYFLGKPVRKNLLKELLYQALK